MKKQVHFPGAVVAGIVLFLAGAPAHAQARARAAAAVLPATPQRETVVTTRASGTFEVKMIPQAPDADGEATVGRMSLDKQFRGDIEGTGRGQMLTVMTPVESSAAYVAMERVTGTLHGRSGSFALQHSGTLDRGAQRLTISVVPDSGTGQLAGLTGTMTIDVSGGKHSYVLEYTLPAAR
jgi:hypothetical protein